jgi:hypothetical protein
MTYQSYFPSELFELAERSTDEVRVVVAVGDDSTGVSLPDWVQPGAILSVDQARRLAAQLLLACDEHDAIQHSAFGLGEEAKDDEPMKGKRDAEEVLTTGIARLSLALVSANTLVEQDAPHAAFRTLHDAVDDLISGCAR